MVNNENTALLESIDNRLKWLLQLRVEEQFDESATNREKVKKLHQMGFENDEMAEAIGTTEASIRGTLSDLRQDGDLG